MTLFRQNQQVMEPTRNTKSETSSKNAHDKDCTTSRESIRDGHQYETNDTIVWRTSARHLLVIIRDSDWLIKVWKSHTHNTQHTPELVIWCSKHLLKYIPPNRKELRHQTHSQRTHAPMPCHSISKTMPNFTDGRRITTSLRNKQSKFPVINISKILTTARINLLLFAT